MPPLPGLGVFIYNILNHTSGFSVFFYVYVTFIFSEKNTHKKINEIWKDKSQAINLIIARDDQGRLPPTAVTTPSQRYVYTCWPLLGDSRSMEVSVMCVGGILQILRSVIV